MTWLRLHSIVAVLWFAGTNLFAQTFQFRHFGSADGIHYPFIYTLNQDENGYLWIGTGEGLYRYDGIQFMPFLKKDGLQDNFIHCSYKDSRGRIWFGHNSGGVSCLESGTFKGFDLSMFTKSRVNAIIEFNNEIWIASQNDGLLKIRENGKAKAYYKDFQGKLIYDMIPFGKELLLATDEGLLLASLQSENDDIFNLRYLDEGPLSPRCMEVFADSSCLIGTEDEGLFMLERMADGQVMPSSYGEEFQLSGYRMEEVRVSPEGAVWISTTGNSLVQLVPSTENGKYERIIRFGLDKQLPNDIHTSFVDREGNLWVGSFGQGLSRLVSNHFSFYKFNGKEHPVLEVHSFLHRGDSMLIGTNEGLHLALERPSNVVEIFDSSSGLPKDSVIGIVAGEQGELWAATSANGLFRKSTGKSVFEKFHLSQDKLSELISVMESDGSTIYLGTKNGLYLIDTKEGTIEQLTNRNGLLHNKIRSLLLASDGKLWIGSEGNGLNYLQHGKVFTSQIGNGNRLLIARCIAEDKQGRIFIGTEGNGVLAIGDHQIEYTNSNALFSNYCKSIVVDGNNRLWVSHTGGLSRIDLNSQEFEVFDEKDGMGHRFNDNGIVQDEESIVWMCTDAGLLRYDGSKEATNEVEPVLNIMNVWVGDIPHTFNEDIELESGSYKLKFAFLGISHRDPEAVTYKYILEGHDLDWSELSAKNEVQYNRIDPGIYTFKVAAFNADGVGGNTVRTVRLIIPKPFWQSAWFILCGLLLIFGVIRYIIFRRENFLRRNQEYLQAELQSRTKEVISQKELLEKRNKDITSSIEYARNIQRAMLPEEERISGFFQDAFVFFKPRDIVSGDFYWAEKFGSKRIIACADCTGHGVPGAFMSLIGTAILKEVCHMKSIHSPDAVLTELDKELRNLVSRNNGELSVSDGMDISILEFDEVTQVLRVASARRPVIVYKNGQRIEIRGDRRSIGGAVLDDRPFSMHAIQLNDGDSIYMFSDGICDQFGGERGKKLKLKGVVEFLDEQHHKSMEQQRLIIKEQFLRWKGHHPQIDDIIFMGIRI